MYAPDAYHLICPARRAEADLVRLIDRVWPRVFRNTLDEPGFAVILFESPITSQELRRFMVDLKRRLCDRILTYSNRPLAYQSMGRFDQQATTKFHLDGSPDEAYLMLGYEPTPVESRIAIADYSRAAHDRGISPKSLLLNFNPMRQPDDSSLESYVTLLPQIQPDQSHVLLINNSSCPLSNGDWSPQGVMHRAVIPMPIPRASRIVNSTMIIPVDSMDEELVDESGQEEFVSTSVISGRP